MAPKQVTKVRGYSYKRNGKVIKVKGYTRDASRGRSVKRSR
jgi:hypothetical protein